MFPRHQSNCEVCTEKPTPDYCCFLFLETIYACKLIEILKKSVKRGLQKNGGFI